ncbi:Asp23/Gls24 family envelope stress response protein [Micromonospora sp. WMMD729]|uniref:Asp23/Gls24 family envelope stress response protein n=1 Tax=Micromonospora sp. WMMD729 TaxID=3404127 RepID=UPI003BF4BF42
MSRHQFGPLAARRPAPRRLDRYRPRPAAAGRDAAARVGRIAVDAAGRVPGVCDVRPVTVRLDDRSVGLDLDLVTEYGHRVPALADAVRRAVAARVYADTGHAVAAVTITVRDLVLPDSGPATPRPAATPRELTMATVNRVASALLAVTLLVGGVLLATQALLAAVGRLTTLLLRPGWADTLTTTRWHDPGVRTAAGVAVGLGLVVLAAQLRRWTPVRLRVDQRDGWHLYRRCVERRLTDAVDTVPGVRRTQVRVRRDGDRWRPRLRATGDPAARAEVEFAVRQELRHLAAPGADRVDLRLLPHRRSA